MPITKIQPSFSSGELSPRLLARIDLDAYGKGVKTMTNAYPFLHGGCRRRPGTLFVGETINANENARIIPFDYSASKAYLLVLNGGKMQFITNGGFVKVTGVRYQIDIPYSSADLVDLKFCQAGNLMFFTHPNYKPKQLLRFTETSWVLQDIVFNTSAVADYRYENFAIGFKILSSSEQFPLNSYFTIVTNSSGGIASFSAITGAPAPGAGKSYGVLAAITATALAPSAETWTVTCTYSSSTRTEWSVSGSISGKPPAQWCANNYPSCVAFHEQRLWLAAPSQFPQKLWASKIGDYTNFTLGPNNDDAVAYQIDSDTFDKILHIKPSRSLLVFTTGSEYSVEGGQSVGVTPTSVRIVKQTQHGSTNAIPIKIGQEIVFVQRDALKVRALSYNVTVDANVAPDITLFSEHITNSGIEQMTFAQSPDYIAWLTKTNGDMLSLTLARDYEQIGWARHTTDGDFEHAQCIHADRSDDVYFSVKRVINGVEKRYIEVLDQFWDAYSDSAICQTNATKQTVWTGYGHLEGKTVDVVADGLVHGQRVVTGGSITLDYGALEVRVGLHYGTVIEMLHPEVGNINDSSQGRKVSINDIVARLQDTVGCTINGYSLPFRKFSDGLDSRIEPFTGDKSLLSTGWRSPNNIRIEQNLPMPFTLLGVILKASVTA